MPGLQIPCIRANPSKAIQTFFTSESVRIATEAMFGLDGVVGGAGERERRQLLAQCCIGRQPQQPVNVWAEVLQLEPLIPKH